MNEEGVVAVLGLVLMTQPDQRIEIPRELIENGLPDNSGVQLREDPIKDVLIVSIESYENDGE